MSIPMLLSGDEPIEPEKYDYYRDTWPLIVAQAFDRGWRMYACRETITRDDQGHKIVLVEKTMLLDREMALAYRGTTRTECNP